LQLDHIHFVQSVESGSGGLGIAAAQLSAALRAVGKKSVTVSTCAASSGQCVDVIELPRVGPKPLYFSLDLFQTAGALTESGRPYIHGHGFYVSPNAVFGAVAKKKKLPLIYHPHGMFDPWILKRSRLKKRLVHILFENRNFRYVSMWRALTVKEADQIRHQGITAPVVVIPNGVDLDMCDLWKSKLAQRSASSKTILFLGRLHPKKGLDLLIYAWAKLANRFSDWKLVIAGPDEANYLMTLRKMIQNYGLENRVEFPGVVSGVEKYAALHDAGLFALTSYSEGFPMAVLEAMAASTPVLASIECNLPGLERSGAGWLCDVNADSVAAALEDALASSDSERHQRGVSGRKLVEECFDWKKLARELHENCLALQ
jgi:glycosyltransferase involved in cell wall biosynthesis